MTLFERAKADSAYNNWFSSTLKNKILLSGNDSRKETHRINCIVALLRYYSQNWDDIPEKTTYQDLFCSIKTPADRCNSNIAKGKNYYQILLSWLSKLVAQADTFAQMVNEYFAVNKKDFKYFAAVTFPNLFLQFESAEFAEKGKLFMERLITISNPEFYGPFLVSFYLAIPTFCNTFWNVYHQEIFKFGNRAQHSNMFMCFRKALQISTSKLPLTHIEIARSVIETNKGAFAKYFIGEFLKQLYNENTAGRSDESTIDAMNEFLDFLANHSEYPQTRAIFDIFTDDACFSEKLWPMAYVNAENKAHLVMTCKDFYLTDDIIKQQKTTFGLENINPLWTLNAQYKDSLILDFCEIQTTAFVKPGIELKYPLAFEKRDKYEFELTPQQSRLWKMLKNQRDTEFQDIFDIIQNQKIGLKYIPMKSDDKEAFLKTIVNESITNNEEFEHYIVHALISKLRIQSHQESITQLNSVLHYVSQFLFEKPKKPTNENSRPLAPIGSRLMNTGRMSSGFFKRMSISFNNLEAEITNQQNILTTAAFANPDDKDVKEEFRVPSKHIKDPFAGGLSGRASTFCLDIEEEPAEVKPQPKKQRRNSGDDRLNTMHKQKSIVNEVGSKYANPSEMMLWAIIKSTDFAINSLQSTTSLYKEYVAAVEKKSLKDTFNLEKLPDEVENYITKVVKICDDAKQYKTGTLMYTVLEALQSLKYFSEKYDLGDKVFVRVAETMKTDALIITCIWYQKCAFSYDKFTKSLPNSIDQSGQFISTKMIEYLQEFNPDLAARIHESYHEI